MVIRPKKKMVSFGRLFEIDEENLKAKKLTEKMIHTYINKYS